MFFGAACACGGDVLGVRKLSNLVAYEKRITDTPSISQQRVTELLAQWSNGDNAALAELTPLIYEELRRLAHHQWEDNDSTTHCKTTASVNEPYLADQTRGELAESRPFFRRSRASDAPDPR
jgi:hypothetical protein